MSPSGITALIDGTILVIFVAWISAIVGAIKYADDFRVARVSSGFTWFLLICGPVLLLRRTLAPEARAGCGDRRRLVIARLTRTNTLGEQNIPPTPAGASRY